MKPLHLAIASLAGVFSALLGACSAHAVPPVLLTNVMVTVYGEESSAIVHERGELFLYEEDGTAALWFGDGETPGGHPVDTHLPVPDVYHWEDDVHANSHALVLNPEFAIQATANSLDFRFEEATVLRIVGNTNGFYVPYAYSFQPEGSTFAISSALVDGAALTLLCSTNLTSVPNFREVPGNLATVTTNNGVVTWEVSADALMAPSGANICVFRVRANTSFGTGIYANAPIVAEQGLSMGGTTWTNLPDIGAIATNAADAAVAPVAADLADHAADTDNPHGVTAAQVGAVPTTGGTITGNLSISGPDYRSGKLSHGLNPTNTGIYSFAGGENVRASGQNTFSWGYFTEATAYGARATGSRSRATATYAQAAGLKAVASNVVAYVWQGADGGEYGSHGDRTWNINPQGGLSGAYVGETNLAAHLAAAVAPVAGRVGELEARAEEYWCKWTTWSDTEDNYIPTNWPARKVRCHIYITNTTNAPVFVLPDWAPGGAFELDLIILKTSSGSGFAVTSADGQNLCYTTASSAQYRVLELRWRPDFGVWTAIPYTLATPPWIVIGGQRAYPVNSSLPEVGE